MNVLVYGIDENKFINDGGTNRANPRLTRLRDSQLQIVLKY